MISTGSQQLSIWILAPLLLLGALLAYVSYRRLRRTTPNWWWILFILRLVLITGVIVLLINITFSWSSTFAKIPLIRIFFDNSVSAVYHQSVSSESLNEGYNEIKTILQEMSPAGMKEVRVECYSLGVESELFDDSENQLDFSAPSTYISSIFNGIESIPPDQFLAGIVLVSDGQYTVGGDPLQLVESVGVPVYTIGIGQTTPLVDVRIERIEVPTVGIKGGTEIAEVDIISTGAQNERVNVTVSKGKKLIGSKVITLSGDGSVNVVKFQFQLDEEGLHTYTVHTSSVKDEINIENNRSSFDISVLKNQFQVAHITGVLSPNTSFIQRLLEEDKRFNVDQYIHLPDEWQKPLAHFWRSNYDLIILDNFPNSRTSWRFVTDLGNKLKSYPAALAWIAGPNLDSKRVKQFYPLFGVQESTIKFKKDKALGIEFSNSASRHPIFSISDPNLSLAVSSISLPPVRPFLMIEAGSDQMKSLAMMSEISAIPLFCVGELPLKIEQPRFRTAIYSSPDLWRLHFRIMDTGYARFVEEWWKRTFNWLVKSSGESDLYFRLNKKVFQQGESIQAVGTVMDLNQGQIGDGEVVCMVIKEDEVVGSYPLYFSRDSDQWEGTFFASRPGMYEYLVEVFHSGILIGEYKGSFRVEESQIELNDVSLNKPLLTGLAQKSGGAYLDWEYRSSISECIVIKPRSVLVDHSIHFSHWLPFGIILLVIMVVEWIVRRTFNLL